MPCPYLQLIRHHPDDRQRAVERPEPHYERRQRVHEEVVVVVAGVVVVPQEEGFGDADHMLVWLDGELIVVEQWQRREGNRDETGHREKNVRNGPLSHPAHCGRTAGEDMWLPRSSVHPS